MDSRDAFEDRENAFEEGYFRAEDARLLEKLRARTQLGEIADALAQKLQVDDAALLEEIRGLGITHETGAALLLAPLVQVAWAEGGVTERERSTVLELAAARGVEPGTPAYARLTEWLETRPPERLFEVAIRAIQAGLSVLDPAEREDRLRHVNEACRFVAAASGGLAGLFGLGGEISREEAALVSRIADRLKSH